jgi:hypothetical protein
MRNVYLEIISICKAGMRMEGRSVVKSLNVFRNGFLEFADILSGRKVFAILQVRDPIPGLLLTLRILRELATLLAGYPTRLFFRESHATAQDN